MNGVSSIVMRLSRELGRVLVAMPAGTVLGEATPLFNRIDAPAMLAEIEAENAAKAEPEEEPDLEFEPEMTFDDFMKADLRVAKGRELEDVVFRGCAFTRCADGTFPGRWKQKGAAYWWNEGRDEFRGLKGVRFDGCTFTDVPAK